MKCFILRSDKGLKETGTLLIHIAEEIRCVFNDNSKIIFVKSS